MRRCPAVLLTGGWFLFTPPLFPDGKVNTASPLSEWSHEKSFDTAKECEAYKEEARSRAGAIIERGAQINKPPQTDPMWRFIGPTAYRRCIPSDGIKLK